ncbi:MAG: acylphosphatase [Gemmatimonadota bacterium]|nr:MAG: acylphosphatase [Gemmatimonadota bacterium]
MSAAGSTARAFRVHGLVQGVGFRYWAHHQARALGLRGTVRNCRDGTVEIEFAGPQHAVEEMCRRLQIGPPAADIRKLEELPPPQQLPESFVIGF